MKDASYALISEVSRVLIDSVEADGVVGNKVRVDLMDIPDVVVVEEPIQITIEVTNLGQVIRSFRVELLGLDGERVSFDPPVLDLFPWERQAVTATITLPLDHPAGRQRLAAEVIEVGPSPSPPAIAEFSVEVEGRPGMAMSSEPASQEVGSSGTFILHIENTGNMPLPVRLEGSDAERLLNVTFDPPRPVVPAGETVVVRALVKGPRPWFGMSAIRVLELRAEAKEIPALATVVLMQRPKISRRLVTFVGFLLVVSLFAFIMSRTFGRVADLSEQNQALLASGLGFEEVVSDRVVPGGVSGAVTSSTGAGIDGAAVRLYDVGNIVQPVHTTVTAESGEFALTSVADGEYLLETEAAGFGSVWFPGAATVDGASPVEVKDGAVVSDVSLVLAGRPGGVQGQVVGSDVAGALVQVRLPADVVLDSSLPPVPSVVAQAIVDDTGQFELTDLATPATYEIAVVKAGYATELRTVTLRAGETRTSVEVLLRRGIGRLSGTVVNTSGEPIGGVQIIATDGATQVTTRSLSGAESPGIFDLRNLATPGTYTLTLTSPGFFDESVTLTLDTEQQRTDLAIIMTSDTGRVGGVVVDASGNPLGGVTVTVTGADLVLTTETLTVGDKGAWSVDALPVPGSYTVTFTRDGFTTTATTIDLASGPSAVRSDVDVVLSAAAARVAGRVLDSQGNPISGVRVTMESSDVTRRTVTSDVPAGQYVISGVPAGAYTLTFDRDGSSPQTLLVDLRPGQQVEVPDVTLEAQARITGVVTRDGVPASDVGIVVHRERDYPNGIVAETATGSEGQFVLVGLNAPETYVIDFHVPAGGPVVESRTVFLQPDEVRELRVDL